MRWYAKSSDLIADTCFLEERTIGTLGAAIMCIRQNRHMRYHHLVRSVFLPPMLLIAVMRLVPRTGDDDELARG